MCMQIIIDHAGFARVLQKYRLAKYDPAAAAAAAVDSGSADDAAAAAARKNLKNHLLLQPAAYSDHVVPPAARPAASDATSSDGAAATAARGVTVDDASLVRNMQLEVQKRLHEQLEVQSLFRAASIDL